MSSDQKKIPFNIPYMTGDELANIEASHQNGQLAGDGPYTGLCHSLIEQQTTSPCALLTHSCTAALEMSALLLNISPGDEVIMPSYTFVSTANAFALRGAKIVFVDIREDTLNLDETLIEAAITPRTRAIVPVHYAGVACEMDTIADIAQRHGIPVVEDAAQGFMASYKGRPLGSIGDLGTISFHETKNIISGEGGCLLVNEPSLIQRAEILREKGTDRSRFFRGEVDKYTWQDIGSSFLPGELTAAFLHAQLSHATEITEKRLAIWNHYFLLLSDLEEFGLIRRPSITDGVNHNAHMFYILVESAETRDRLLTKLKASGIGAVFHYVPLHSSTAGKKFGQLSGNLINTESAAKRLIRLPLWIGLTQEQQYYICSVIQEFYKRH